MGATSGSMFTPVQVELVASEPEIAGLDLLNKTKFSKVRTVEPMPELTKVADAAEKMQVMLDAVIQYVEAVLDGTEDPDQFEVMLNSNMRDLLMVVYLSQMTKTQLQLNEKLSMVSVNNLREVAKLLPAEER